MKLEELNGIELQDLLEYNFYAGAMNVTEKRELTEHEIREWSKRKAEDTTEEWISHLSSRYLKETDAERKKNIKKILNKLYNIEMLNAEDVSILAL